MDTNIVNPAVNVPAIETEAQQAERESNLYIYPAGLNSDRGRSTFRRAIRNGQIAAIEGKTIQVGALTQIKFKSKERTQITNTERALLAQLRAGK